MVRKSYNFNEEFWHRGYEYNCFFEDKLQVKRVEASGVVQKSFYISSSIDGGESQMKWHRMKAAFESFGESNIKISFYASDKKTAVLHGEEVDLDGYLEDFALSGEEKYHNFGEIWQKTLVNMGDIFLGDLVGRYLWFQIEFVSYDHHAPWVSTLEIQYPLDSIGRFLPEFYGASLMENNFTTKFLALFQSLIFDLQTNIEDISQNLDFDYVEGDNFQWLADCLFDELPFYREDGNFLEFVKSAFRLYQKKGTKSCMEEVLALYVGVKPVILENFQIQDALGKNPNSEILKLYSDNEYVFYVLIESKYVATMESQEVVQALIEIFKPAQTVGKLVLLKEALVLGEHTYLGVNSQIVTNKNMVLTENATMPFDSTIGE